MKIELSISSYDEAFFGFINKVIDGFLSVDSMLGNFPVEVTRHSGSIRNIRGPQAMDHPMTPTEHSLILKVDTIRQFDIEDFIKSLMGLTEKMVDSAGKNFVQVIQDVTSSVGNTIDAQGQTLSYDMYIDALEKIQIEFDDAGNFERPVFYAGSGAYEKLKNIVPTPEQIKREEEVIDRKRKEFNAKKRTRRLSR